MNQLKLFYAGSIFFVSAFIPCTSFAGFYDGYQIKVWIEADDRTNSGNARTTDWQVAAQLSGYVTGVYDAYDGVFFCAPNGVKVGQSVGIVKKYVLENPQEWNRSADFLVTKALISVFPCNK